MILKYELIDINDNKEILESKNIKDKTKEGYFYFNQYERGKRGEILKFAVQISDYINIDKIRIYLNNNKEIEFEYNSKTNHFYIDREVGIEKAGFFYLTIEDIEKNSVHITDKILVKPSIISIEQYNSMIDMLLNINMLLVNNKEEEVYLEREGKGIDITEYWKNVIVEIENCLNNIEKNPGKKLIKEEMKTSYNKIKKFNSKILLEKRRYPFKNKFLAEVTKESFNIYENRVIYSFLSNFEKVIKLAENEVRKLLKSEKREQIEIDTILSGYINSEYRGALNIRKEKITSKLEILKKRIQNLEFCNIKILEYLKSGFFSEFKNIDLINEEPQATQLFMHDIFYREMYSIIQEFNHEISKQYNMDIEELKIGKLHEIFEVWAYFYMVKIMIREQGWNSDYNIISSANEYIEKNNGLYGFSINLKHYLPDDRIAKLKIIYNKTLNLNSKKLRPDYTFEFEVGEERKVFYLDAKYHNYMEVDKSFNKDIKEVAISKYYNELIGTEYQATGSYILHCIDKNKYRYFGENKEASHRIGSFAMLENRNTNFKVWISLIMEWFYEEYRVCWNCGNIENKVEVEKTRGGNLKEHITCDECGSFWVKTNCNDCNCRKIIKHDVQSKQYHKDTEKKWMVHCPMCGSSGQVKKYRTQGIVVKNNKCTKCKGQGKISRYGHIESGRCFKCSGTGIQN